MDEKANLAYGNEKPINPNPDPTVTSVLFQPAVQKVPHRNEQRPTWSNPMEYLCAAISYVVGYGTIWRIPYLMYKHSAPFYLLAYIVMLMLVGIPMLLLETYIGQFTSNGVLTCWEMFPLFKGLGVAIFFLSAITGTYYAIINAWVVNYFFLSWQRMLPWANCINYWNTPNCDDGSLKPNYPDNSYEYNNDYMYNFTYIGGPISHHSPAFEYFYYKFLQTSDGIENVGSPRWQIVLALLATWIVIAVVTAFGPKVYGKVAYVAFFLPIPLVAILLIRILTLPGAIEGLKYLFYPTGPSKLADFNFWLDVVQQVVFSLGVGLGPLITLSSYNKFRNDCIRDTFIIPFVHLFISLIASIMVMGMVGFLAYEKNASINDVITAGIGLAFDAIPSGLALIPVAPLWSALFYLILIIIGLGSLFAIADTIVTAIVDLNIKFLRLRFIVAAVVCGLFFIFGLPYTTNGGLYLFVLFDHYVYFNMYFVCLAELFCIAALYGVFTYAFTHTALLRFKDDLSIMLGGKGCHCVPWIICWPIWSIMWFIITPVIIIVTWFITQGRNTEIFLSVGNSLYYYPYWAKGIGALLAHIPLFIMAVTPIVMLIMRCCCKGNGLSVSLEYLIKPSKYWGPALPKYRERMSKYLPPSKYVIDPWSDSSNTMYLQNQNASQAF